MATLMCTFLQFHNHTLVHGQRITNLLKKEIIDEGKAKVADELANMKKKYEANHKAWAKEKKTLERDESEERRKT